MPAAAGRTAAVDGRHPLRRGRWPDVRGPAAARRARADACASATSPVRDAASAGSYAYINPAIAVLLGAWLAHERFSGSELAAMGVILLGVVAITLAKAAAPGMPAPEAKEQA